MMPNLYTLRYKNRYITKSTILMFFIVVVVIVAVEFGDSAVNRNIVAAERDSIITVFAVDRSADVNLDGEFAQSFVVPELPGSPICDSENQSVVIDGATIYMKANHSLECFRRANDVMVSIREDREGDDIATSRITYQYPTSGFIPVSVQFDDHVRLTTNREYFLVIRQSIGDMNLMLIKHWLAHDLADAGFEYDDIRRMDNLNSVGVDSAGDLCTGNQANSNASIEIAISDEASYDDGDSDASYHDIVGNISYSYTEHQKVLAIIYNPTIGTVSYSDNIGSISSYDYGEEKLVSTMSWNGWSDPSEQIDRLKSYIEDVSQRSIFIDVDSVVINDWAPHESGTIDWRDNVGVLKTISNYSKWTNNTWPCYIHIPESENYGLSGLRYRRSCYPSFENAFDYDNMLSVIVDGTNSIKTLVDDGTYDEIWVVADPTSNLYSSMMLVPTGDSGYPLDGPVHEIYGLDRRVVVMGFSFDWKDEDWLRMYAFRVERVFAAVFNGNTYASCLVNVLDGSIYNQFTRLSACQAAMVTGTPPPGSVGFVMMPFNGELQSTTSWQFDQLVRYRSEYSTSDIERWIDYPGEDYAVREVNCQEWGCRDLGYYLWWMNQIPNNSGQTNGRYNNLWPYVANPACFSAVSAPRHNATPQSTP